jgi:hypothetical protein
MKTAIPTTWKTTGSFAVVIRDLITQRIVAVGLGLQHYPATCVANYLNEFHSRLLEGELFRAEILPETRSLGQLFCSQEAVRLQFHIYDEAGKTAGLKIIRLKPSDPPIATVMVSEPLPKELSQAALSIAAHVTGTPFRPPLNPPTLEAEGLVECLLLMIYKVTRLFVAFWMGVTHGK